MGQRVHTDISISIAKNFLKLCGVWFTMNDAEKRQQSIAWLWFLVSTNYGIYIHGVSIYHYWGENTSNVLYCVNNVIILSTAAVKVIILRFRTLELEKVVRYAERNFWHYNYKDEEKPFIAQCQKYCRLWIIFVLLIPPASVCSYVVTPIYNNIGRNKSDRDLPFEIWTDFPTTETPYFELIFTFQVLCLLTVGVAYCCPDTFMCILNIHAVFQFRILHHKIRNCFVAEQKDVTQYLEDCTAAMKECVNQHQSLIFFCEMIECVFTLATLWHMVIFSLLLGLSGYQIFLSQATLGRRAIFMFLVTGSFIHLIIFAYCCDDLMEESSNICDNIYFGSWNTLPMNKIGRMLRLNARIIMLRAMKPCCLTAGGFFPVSMQTATSLLSSAFSYFTLMRERFVRNDSQ